jgi:hypothetical protein
LNPGKGEPSQDICNKCDKFGACPGRHEKDGTGTTYNVSQGIGAWCKRLKTFCDTTAECASECAAVSNPCEPVKTVCDKDCN